VGLSWSAPASAQPYQLVDLGTLGGSTSFALDINNNRQVSGNAQTPTGQPAPRLNAFFWSPPGGPMQNIGTLPGSNNFSRGYAINDFGVVVGESDNNSSRAFRWDSTNGMTGLTRLAGDNDRGIAHDINNAGTIVGISNNGTVSRATRWTNGVAEDLGTIAGTSSATGRAWAINRGGQIAGLSTNASGTSQATLWSGGTITNLSSLGDGTRFSQAFGINDSGVVVGSSSTGQTVGQLIGTTSTTPITRAFSWASGAITELSPFNLFAPGNTGPTTNYHSVANDINISGLIVGNSQRIAGSAAVATLWQNGVAIDLNTLIAPGSGWNLLSAEGINDAGDIVGFGTFQGSSRAFMLTIPTPGAVAVLAMGGVLAARRRRATSSVDVGTPVKPQSVLAARSLLAAAGAMALTSVASAQIAPAYTITPISVTGSNYVAGEAINASGQVAVGSFDTTDTARGFSWTGGVLTAMGDLPGGVGSYANGINAGGTIAGFASNAAGQRRAIAWTSGGGMLDLGTLGGDRSEARGINDSGVIVGNSRNGMNQRRAFSYTSGGGMVELPMTLGGSSASANAINAAGLIAGSATTAGGDNHASRFDPITSTTLDLGTLGGAESFANGINVHGHVVGLAETADDFRPFFWSQSSGMIDLFASGNLGATFGAAYDVNASGIVVGYGEINDNFDANAFAWTLSDGLVNLNSRLVGGAGWSLFGASGINDAGQIVGWGTLDGVATGYVLTPIPSPGAAMVLGLGGLFIGRRRRA
jgi:probable HAF family extracellular repeat protein